MFIVDADIPVYLHPKLIGKGSGREIFDWCVVDGLGMVDWGMVDWAMVSTKTWSDYFLGISYLVLFKTSELGGRRGKGGDAEGKDTQSLKVLKVVVGFWK